MEHYFELPVHHKGEELILKGRLVATAYSYKFFIVVNGSELIIEKDDEEQLRVLIEEGQVKQLPDKALIADILDAVQQIVT
jgi:hypothetical protein